MSLENTSHKDLSALNLLFNCVTMLLLIRLLFTLDIESYKNSKQFITIYDQGYETYREEDIKRLSKLSLVLGFPKEQDQILEAVAA